jgi:hypothetical protein
MRWVVAEHMYKQVLLKTITTIQTSRFLLVTSNEVMTTYIWTMHHGYQ